MLLKTVRCLAAMLLPLSLPASAQPDSSVTNALGAKLDEYMLVIGTEPAETKCTEADFLISSCSDSLVRQFTAVRLYSHFMESRLMGDEAVAIHIFDKWFAPGKVKMPDETGFMNARIFATFNRQSLIGNRAPELYMESIDGEHVTVFGDDSGYGKPSVLFFYDSSCPTCKMDAVMLRSILREETGRIDLYAIYTQQTREDWERFADEYLDIGNPQVNVIHLWDPELRSDYQMKYGVLQTPSIFFVTRERIIAGRRLDIPALKQLLDIYCRPYVYGSPESGKFYDRVFSSYGQAPGCTDVKEVCDSIACKTLGQNDTLTFKQMAGDLMYWLGSHRGEGIKCGLGHLIDKYIAGKPDVWTESGDSLNILSYSEILKDLLDKNPVGERLPDIEVPGILMTWKTEKQKTIRLDRLHRTTVIFHTEGCDFCKAALEAADSSAKADRRLKYFIVDIDSILDTDPELGYRLFEEFDLTVMPHIIMIDNRGRVSGKYISLD